MQISWQEFSKDIDNLVKKLGWTPQGLLAVERGGLIPAAKIAYILGIRYIHTVIVDKDEPSITRPEYVFSDYRDWLIVDDIVDSGRTVSILRDYYGRSRICTVYAKEDTKNLVDYYSRIVPDEWQTFPWEEEYRG